ncbi:MAG: restriction endonuclease subunit S [Methylobacter sp.]
MPKHQPKQGWHKVKFGDVVRLSKERSQDPLADGYERYVGLEHLEPGDLRIRSWGNVADGTTFTSVFKPGQVLFGKRRAYQRKVAVADFSGVCSGDIYVLESSDANVLLPDLLPFICQTDAFFEHAVGTSAGSLSPRTNWASLAGFEFMLPPLNEQQRIISLLLALDQAYDQYSNARDKAWQLHKGYLETLHAKASSPGSSIKVVPLSEACSHVVDCLHRTPLYELDGIPAIRTTDIENGVLKLDQAYRVSESEYEIQASRLRPIPNDIVYSREAPMGYAALIPPKTRVCISQRVMHFRAQEDVNPTYLMEALNSPFVKKQVEKFATGSTVKHINVGDVKKLLVALPAKVQQDEVANILTNIRIAISAIEARTENIRSLRQQILAKEVAA